MGRESLCQVLVTGGILALSPSPTSAARTEERLRRVSGREQRKRKEGVNQWTAQRIQDASRTGGCHRGG